MSKRRFYRRDGTRVSKARVAAAQVTYVEAKRTTGRIGMLVCSIQPAVADAVERMSLEEFCAWSGAYTYR